MIKARTFEQVSAERMQSEPTPETDLWLKQQIVCNYEHDMVSAGLARQLERDRNKLRAALQRIADCDWVITLPDRMDAVRKIAREALQ